ncbi:unnamed protein product [Pleuronectes platessa]|uniref:Uncharacterized protein n=1 Tax=Pleuronectes platessa TaxID=8262 RepID=A0A9N7Z422_PLEPL|nr:unnamed protein product [Pleuronectes platessa]
MGEEEEAEGISSRAALAEAEKSPSTRSLLWSESERDRALITQATPENKRVGKEEMGIRLICILHRPYYSGPVRQELSSSEVPLRAREKETHFGQVLPVSVFFSKNSGFLL